MKLNAIKKCCADTKSARIVTDGNGDQWITNLYVGHRVSGVRLDEEALTALFDLTKKQIGEWSFSEVETDDWRVSAYPDDRDVPMEWIGSAMLGETELLVLSGAPGIVLVNRAALKPVNEKYRRYYLRQREGKHPMVAVFEDVMCAALVMPISKFGNRTVRALAEKIVRGPWIVPTDDEDEDAANAEAAAERMAASMGISPQEREGE